MNENKNLKEKLDLISLKANSSDVKDGILILNKEDEDNEYAEVFKKLEEIDIDRLGCSEEFSRMYRLLILRLIDEIGVIETRMMLYDLKESGVNIYDYEELDKAINKVIYDNSTFLEKALDKINKSYTIGVLGFILEWVSFAFLGLIVIPFELFMSLFGVDIRKGHSGNIVDFAAFLFGIIVYTLIGLGFLIYKLVF